MPQERAANSAHTIIKQSKIRLIFAILGRLFGLIKDSMIFNIISLICNGTGLALMISGVINCIIRSWVRIIFNLYKDESYLTHTLPILRETHYLSKIISVIITLFISLIILFIGLIIMYYNENTLEFIKQSLNIISDTLNSSVVLFVIATLLVVILEMIFIIFCGNFGIVFGHTFNQKKVSKSFLFGLMAYGISNGISLILILIASIFSQSVKGLLFGGNNEVEFSMLMVLVWCFVILYGIYNIILYLLTSKLFKKGVNID